MEPDTCPSSPPARHRLFYAQADPCLTADEVQAVFEEFGSVVSVRMIEDKATNSSSGCGYVEYASAGHAHAAVSALNGGSRLAAPGLRFTLAFAMLERPGVQEPGSGQGQPATGQDGITAEDSQELERCARTVYFARVPPCVPVEELEELFGSCGKVVNVNLFKPWATSKTSKGCGLVEFATAEAAKKARSSLHEFSYWPNARYPLLVEQALPSALKPPKVAKPPRQQQPKAPKPAMLGMGPADRVRQQLIATKAMAAGWGPMGPLGGHTGHMGAGPTTRLYNPALGTLMQVQGVHGASMAAKMSVGPAHHQQQQYVWDPSCGAVPASSGQLPSDMLLQPLGMGRGGAGVPGTGMAPGLVPLAVSAAPAPDVTPYDRLASATEGWGTEVPVQVAPLMSAQAGGYVELPQGMHWGRDDTVSSASSNLTLSGTHLSGPGGLNQGDDLSSSGYNLVPAQGMALRGAPMQAAHQAPMSTTMMMQQQQQQQQQQPSMVGYGMSLPMNVVLCNSGTSNGMVQRSMGPGMGMVQPSPPMQAAQQQPMQQLQLMLTPNDVASLSGHLGAVSSLTHVGAAIEAHPGVGLALVLTGGQEQLTNAQAFIQLMRGSGQ